MREKIGVYQDEEQESERPILPVVDGELLPAGAVVGKGKAGHNDSLKGHRKETLGSQPLSTQLQWIADKASTETDFIFHTLGYLIDEELLYAAYSRVRKDGAPGVDRMTAEEYAKDVHTRLHDLCDRLKSKRYRATAVKRVWIPKDDGLWRPLGIPIFEDKIVQRATFMLLEPIFEQDFYDFSYGFRPGKSAHDALRDLREQCNLCRVGWILDVDIKGYFDNIDHSLLLDLLHRRVKDGGIDRLIGKWLNAGILDGKELFYPEKGTPQGGVISPLLANIYLHYVLDEWWVKDVQSLLKGRCFLIRFADDYVLGFELESDAQRVLAVLPKRMEKYGLTVHPDKTQLVKFSKSARYAPKDRTNGTFDFLGFTHYRSMSRQGYWVIKRRTIRKRLKRALKRIHDWCKFNRHLPLWEQFDKLRRKLLGHYQYYGIRSNMRMLERVYQAVVHQWQKWLSRRSQKGRGLRVWSRFEKILARYPLPKPRIAHQSV